MKIIVIGSDRVSPLVATKLADTEDVIIVDNKKQKESLTIAIEPIPVIAKSGQVLRRERRKNKRNGKV
jgi:Trk K+ transport system NAD-binding subunit